MCHVVLLGDSIFDNARYVLGEPSVIEHLRKCVPPAWSATLLAVDGAMVEGVSRQAERLPADATHLVISAGGNDALGHNALFPNEPAGSFIEVLSRLGAIREEFQADYRRMLQRMQTLGRPIAVCTVYDAIPGLGRAERAGLSMFNEVILREAAREGVPVIDLRLICDEPGDYAASSPIEPSVMGGGKIARMVSRVVIEHDFSTSGCRIFA